MSAQDAARGGDDEPFIALHGLRLLVAIGILSNHWGDQYFIRLIPQQQLTIDFFFAIEGFLAAHAVSRIGNGGGLRPILDRLIHIYPLYLIGMLAGLCAVLPVVWAQSHGWTPAVMAKAVPLGLALQPTFSTAAEGAVFPFNPPAWAIVLELWAFAALWLFRSRLTLPVLVVVTGAAAVALAGASVYRHDLNLGWQAGSYWGGFLRVTYGFFGGVLLHQLLLSKGSLLPRLNPLILWAAFVAIMFLRVRFVGIPLLLIGLPVVVWLAAVSRDPPALAAVGRFARRNAYGVYLMHFPVLVTFRATGDALGLPRSVMASPWSYLIALGTVILAACLVVRFLDEPIRRGIESWAASRAVRSSDGA